MKRALIILSSALTTATLWAQTAPIVNQQAPGYTYTNPYTQNTPGYNNSGQSGMTFSNRNGMTFSVDQLATSLKSLQASLDQALPALTAFNESFVAANGNSNLGGTISNLLSGVLHRNNNQNNNTGGSAAINNLLTALRQNSNGATTPNANSTRDLETLQSQLTSAQQSLQNLGVAATGYSSQGSQVISTPRYPNYGNAPQTNGYGAPITPTGR